MSTIINEAPASAQSKGLKNNSIPNSISSVFDCQCPKCKEGAEFWIDGKGDDYDESILCRKCGYDSTMEIDYSDYTEIPGVVF